MIRDVWLKEIMNKAVKSELSEINDVKGLRNLSSLQVELHLDVELEWSSCWKLSSNKKLSAFLAESFSRLESFPHEDELSFPAKTKRSSPLIHSWLALMKCFFVFSSPTQWIFHRSLGVGRAFGLWNISLSEIAIWNWRECNFHLSLACDVIYVMMQLCKLWRNLCSSSSALFPFSDQFTFENVWLSQTASCGICASFERERSASSSSFR